MAAALTKKGLAKRANPNFEIQPFQQFFFRGFPKLAPGGLLLFPIEAAGRADEVVVAIPWRGLHVFASCDGAALWAAAFDGVLELTAATIDLAQLLFVELNAFFFGEGEQFFGAFAMTRFFDLLIGQALQ
jgi:hypothetical protein